MLLPLDEARALSIDVLSRHHFNEEDAGIVTDHLLDAHLTGYTFAGLPRLLVVLERLREHPDERPGAVEVVHETPMSAVLDGHGTLGYVLCRRAVDLGIEKAERGGLALVGAHHAYYSGRSGYYAERAARRGLVAVHVSSASAMVAPSGGREPLLGTNPITVAFPAPGQPVVCDMSTSAITWGELQLAARVGESVPPDVAVDATGAPTTDPAAALLGAALPWGGHKGYALSLAVQLFAVLSGGDPVPEAYGNFGFFFLLFRPDLLMPEDTFRTRVGELIDRIKTSATAPGTDAVRIPGERSARTRERLTAAGAIELPDKVYQDLKAF